MAEARAGAGTVRLGLANARGFLAEARLRLAGGDNLLDLARLTEFDSAAIAVLLSIRREYGPSVSFLNPPENLRKLAVLYGVDSLLFAPG